MHAVHIPVSERVLDRLADILFATDEILDMLHVEEHMADDTNAEVEQSVRVVYDHVNELMKRLCD